MVCESTHGIPSLDTIPHDWAIVEADSISLKVSKGTTPPKTEVSEKGDIPFLRVNNLSFYGSLQKDSDFIYVSKTAHEKFLARSKAYPGDVLMNIVGPPLGKTALLDESWPEYNMNQAIVFYRLDTQHIVLEYFLAFLNSHNAQNWLQSRSKKTSGQQNLTIELCKKLPLPLPPIPQQKKIAQILSTWDQAITATERLLENSQQRKKGLMQQLLTGKKRLPGFEGEWETTKVGKICKLGAGQSAPQGEDFFDKGIHDFLRVSDIGSSAGRFAPVSRDRINDRAVQEKRLSKVAAGATVFTKSGASLLLNQRAQLKTDTYIVSHLGFALGTEHSDDDFIYYLFCLIDFGKIAAGTSLPALQLSTLSQIKVTVPTQKQEQNAIAQILGVADREIERIRKRLLLLKQEKQALMQQLLTGKRRVQVDTEAA